MPINYKTLPKLHRAVFENHIAGIIESINFGHDLDALAQCHTPLGIAACCGHIGAATMLLAAGARVDIVDAYKRTALHYASSDMMVNTILSACIGVEAKTTCLDKADIHGNTALHIAAEVGEIEVVAALLAAGADPDATDHEGWTPLYFAAYKGHLEVVLALLEYGANTSASAHDECTPLHLVDDVAIAAALIAAGADAYAVNNYGETPLSLATDAGIIRVLTKAAAHHAAPAPIESAPAAASGGGGRSSSAAATAVTEVREETISGHKRARSEEIVDIDELSSGEYEAATIKAEVAGIEIAPLGDTLDND